MIYTIGRTEAYQKAIKEYGTIDKKGRDEEYDGGSCWQTCEEAKAHCPEDFSVYGIDADWERDTAKPWVEDVSWRSLLRDAKIIEINVG